MSTEKGKVKVIFDTEIKSEKFKMREFVISTEGEYTQDIKFQLNQANCEKADSLKVGDEVEVHYNLLGKSGGWTNKDGVVLYFNTIEAWKIDKLASTESPAVESEASDLPF